MYLSIQITVNQMLECVTTIQHTSKNSFTVVFVSFYLMGASNDDGCLTGIDVKTIRIVVFASLFGIAILCAVAVCTFLLYRRLTSSKWTVRPATTRIKIRYIFIIILAKYYCSTHNPKPQFGTEKGEHKITILFEIKWRRVYICEREKKRDRACRRRKKGKKKQQQHFFFLMSISNSSAA
jgi:nitrate reductase gamma subunit